MSTDLEFTVDVDAPPEVVWAAATDWTRQGEWMLGTRVRVEGGDGRSVGSELSAFSGVGPLGVSDTFRVTTWDPPRSCVVLHTGRVVRGPGAFEVRPRGEGCTFVWSEQLDLPLGRLGALGWPLVRPAFTWGVRRSLRRFAEFCRSYPT